MAIMKLRVGSTYRTTNGQLVRITGVTTVYLLGLIKAKRYESSAGILYRENGRIGILSDVLDLCEEAIDVRLARKGSIWEVQSTIPQNRYV